MLPVLIALALAPAPKPPPEVAVLAPWVGKFRCEVTVPARSRGATLEVTWAAGNLWLSVVFRSVKPPFEGRALAGYDRTKKQYVLWGVDSLGGWFDLSAPSASQTRVSWSGSADVGGQPVAAQFDWTVDKRRAEMKLVAGGQLIQAIVCRR